jgi:enamine deaminase RidA (YjgF/YER057c/UK114 family)
VRGDIARLCGVTPDPVGDVRTQAAQVLARIGALLREAGTDKSRLLTAQVWLADMALSEGHNAAWNAWVDRDNPPARACVRAELWRPGMLVGIMVTAARWRPATPARAGAGWDDAFAAMLTAGRSRASPL